MSFPPPYLSRRDALQGAAAFLGATLMPIPFKAASNDSLADAPETWLKTTRYIDTDHPTIAKTARRLTASASTDLAKTQALFYFVRDEIKFGFARGFWDNRASEVLSAGVGYCNTKSTLFVALLRASGIPARQVFVDIHASVLNGIIDPGTPYVDHSYVEVLLDGAWIATDAYIVDAALFRPAQARVLEEGQLMGYGVHATGTLAWRPPTAAFSQFNKLDPRPISTRHWGVFEDVGAFYQQADAPWNRLNALLREAFGLAARSANRRAEQIRAA